MTEVLTRGQEYDPLLNYSVDNYPPSAEQAEFFKHALLEGETVERPSKLIRGPLYDDFMKILQDVDARIKEVDPEFTAEHIVPQSYQSREARIAVHQLETEQKRALYKIAASKIASLQRFAVGEKGSILREQTISSGSLDVPHYAQQREDWDHGDSARGCANACFRMVFGSITGWAPSQAAVSESLADHYGSSIVDDSVYAGMYQTEVFHEICDKDVVTIELIGADFKTIDTLASRLKQKRPDGEVYCTINLASRTAGADVWHTCVLLEAGGGTVTYHDPSNQNGGAYRQSSDSDFLRRWAVSYNRAVLTIAV